MSNYYKKTVGLECVFPVGGSSQSTHSREIQIVIDVPDTAYIKGRLYLDIDRLKKMLRLILGQRFSSILFYPHNYRDHPFSLESLQMMNKDENFTMGSKERNMVDVERLTNAKVVFIEASKTDDEMVVKEQKFKISYMINGKEPLEESLLNEVELRGVTREDHVKDIVESRVFCNFFFSEMAPVLGDEYSASKYRLHATEISLIYSQIIVSISPLI